MIMMIMIMTMVGGGCWNAESIRSSHYSGGVAYGEFEETMA